TPCSICGLSISQTEPRYNRPDGNYHPACHDRLALAAEMALSRELEDTARRIEAAVADLVDILRRTRAFRAERGLESAPSIQVSTREDACTAVPSLEVAPPSAPLAQRLVAAPGEPWANPLRLSVS